MRIMAEKKAGVTNCGAIRNCAVTSNTEDLLLVQMQRKFLVE